MTASAVPSTFPLPVATVTSETPRAFGINCTLKHAPAAPSTRKLLAQLLRELQPRKVETSSARITDPDVKPGVKTDAAEGDAWPGLCKQVLEANILVLATPTGMGRPSSVAKRVLERMDGFVDEIDENGCYPTFVRAPSVAVVDNEDGAHHVTAGLCQALTDVGVTLPGGSFAYRVGMRWAASTTSIWKTRPTSSPAPCARWPATLQSGRPAATASVAGAVSSPVVSCT